MKLIKRKKIKKLKKLSFKGYYVDAQGNVYSAWYNKAIRGQPPGTHIQTIRRDGLLRKLKPKKGASNRYYTIAIRLATRKYFYALISRLVCEGFYGKPPKGFTASHLNGKRTDNRAENLMWESMRDNNLRKNFYVRT